MNKKLHTKFGTAKIRNDGYYQIFSRKEGNHGKLLHRLIWEDFYGCEVPKGYVIHHRNHIKTDNCILNLQLMRNSDHRKLHITGENHPMWEKHHSEETKQKMSESHKGLLAGENHPMWEKHHSEETRQKMSEAQSGENHPFYGTKRPEHSKKMRGENNPQAKYGEWWNIEYVYYDKHAMFRYNGGNKPKKVFQGKYNGYKLPIGLFYDFVTPEIIGDLIEESIKEEVL